MKQVMNYNKDNGLLFQDRQSINVNETSNELQ